MQIHNDFHPDVGSCGIIFGPMWSGKTTELCKILTTYADVGNGKYKINTNNGLNTLYINYEGDHRATEKSSNYLTTHHSSFRELSDLIVKIRVKNLKDVNVDDFDVIGIDEGHFYDDLDTEVRKWVLEKNKIVYIASLDGDFRMLPIGKAHNLLCICESGNIIKLAARCIDCLKQEIPYRRVQLINAGFTGKIGGSMDKQREVGGKDKYVPLCMKCHKERTCKQS